MKKFFLILMLLFSVGVSAQDYVQEGTTFISTSNKQKSEPIPTRYTWKSGDKVYTIYLTQKGKAFIWKTSKKTGKQYKYYLPNEISEKLKREYLLA